MSKVRFVIRREDVGIHKWALRDGVCRNSEHHNFHDRYWADECTGRCDTFAFFSSAIGTADSRDTPFLQEPVVTRKYPRTMPPDRLAVAALLGSLAGQPPILYESGHGVMASLDGGPLCVCGWDPAKQLPPELRRTQLDAFIKVTEHIEPR